MSVHIAPWLAAVSGRSAFAISWVRAAIALGTGAAPALAEPCRELLLG